ncbi:MAG: glycosyltransferase family 2 protein [Chloroflexi bacterium]|nr:glycosyltransferase family 2 protein [Chloroflexota bacterium]
MALIEALFWLGVGLTVYTYFGYPLLLIVLSAFRGQVVHRGSVTPFLTFIIAAYNEKDAIRGKLENTLALDYPEERLQIIVASDASTDDTDEIVREYEGRGVILNRQAERGGKTSALNDTVARLASGEVLVFSDATTRLQPDALRLLVRNFADERVGAVCARLKFHSTESSDISGNEGAYWKYETFLRRKESEIGALVLVSGAFYGIRREVFSPVPPFFADDCISPLETVSKGYRVVFEEEALGLEEMASTARGEARIKTRGATRDIEGILSRPGLLNPFRRPLVALALVSHKLLRWSVPLFLFVLLASNAVLLSAGLFYRATFGLQLAFYFLAFWGWKVSLGKLLSMPFYFCLVNYSALIAVANVLRGRRRATWTPVRR